MPSDSQSKNRAEPRTVRGLPAKLIWVIVGGVLVASVVSFTALRQSRTTPASNPPVASAAAAVSTPAKAKTPATLGELLALPPEEVEKLDLALLGLLTAEGLRGSENLNVQECLNTLDAWTRHVDREIKRNYHRFLEHPEEYNHSEGEFRMGMLVTILQQDFKAHYSPDRAAPQIRGEWEPDDLFYADSKETFIHGLLSGDRSGTCSSLPVLYAAVALRLGWPVHLAATKAHWFVRYEEGDKHLNIDGAGDGFNVHPDEFYKTWPFPTTDEEIKTYGLFQPLNNKQVLGELLVNRAGNLKSAKRLDESLESWRQAARYLHETPELNRILALSKIRAQTGRDEEKWSALWAEVTKLKIPEGPQSTALRNRKARVQFFMVRSTHVATIEGEVMALKNDLAEYEKAMVQARDSSLPMAFDPVPAPQSLQPVDTGVVRIRNNAGKEMLIPAERIPVEYRHSVPPELLTLIGTMDDEASIEMELWAHYRSQNRQGSPRRIQIPQDQIPPEYWNGLPPELLAQLQDEQQANLIINKIWLYHASEMNRQSREIRGVFQPKTEALSVCPSCGKFHVQSEHDYTQASPVTVDPRRLPMEYQRSIPPELLERLQGKTSDWEIIQEAQKFHERESQRRTPAYQPIGGRGAIPGDPDSQVKIEIVPRAAPP